MARVCLYPSKLLPNPFRRYHKHPVFQNVKLKLPVYVLQNCILLLIFAYDFTPLVKTLIRGLLCVIKAVLNITVSVIAVNPWTGFVNVTVTTETDTQGSRSPVSTTVQRDPLRDPLNAWNNEMLLFCILLRFFVYQHRLKKWNVDKRDCVCGKQVPNILISGL